MNLMYSRYHHRLLGYQPYAVDHVTNHEIKIISRQTKILSSLLLNLTNKIVIKPLYHLRYMKYDPSTITVTTPNVIPKMSAPESFDVSGSAGEMQLPDTLKFSPTFPQDETVCI